MEDADVTEKTNLFKSTLINNLVSFRNKIFTSSKKKYFDWKVLLSAALSANAVAFICSVLGLLTAVNIVSGVVTGGVSTGLTALVLVPCGCFAFYRIRKKKKEFERAKSFFEREGTDKNIELVSDYLTLLNLEKIMNCSNSEAVSAANEITQMIKKSILKDPNFSFADIINFHSNTNESSTLSMQQIFGQVRKNRSLAYSINELPNKHHVQKGKDRVLTTGFFCKPSSPTNALDTNKMNVNKSIQP